MSVRRLDPVQPEGFAFSPDNLAWARKTIGNYPPGKQASAVIAILWRAQEQNGGWVSRPAMEYVGRLLDMAFIRVYEIATFYTMFQLSPVGRKAHIQLCGTTPCMLRGAEDLKEVCRRKIHREPHHLSADGDFSWEEVECLGACVNAPMVQIWKDTYEDLTPRTFEKIIDDLAAGKQVRPGPQNGRQLSAPEGGPTTLTDKSFYDGKRSPARDEPAAISQPAPVPVMGQPVAAVAPPSNAGKPVTAAEETAPTVKSPSVVKTDEVASVGRKREGRAAAAEKPAKAPERVAASKRSLGQGSGAPELLKKPRGGSADDLKLIWGVGPKLEQMLNKMGIWHFSQIASWTKTELAWVDERLDGFKGRAKRDEWIKQAKKLAKGWRPDNAVGEQISRTRKP